MKILLLTTIVFTTTLNVCSAAIMTYGDRTTFQNELTSSQTIDFEGDGPLTFNNFSNPAGFTSGGVDFVGNHPISANPYYLYRTDFQAGTYASDQGLTSDFLLGEGRGDIDMTLPSGVNAIGLDIYATEVAIGMPINFTFVVNGTDTFAITGPARTPNFFGVISDDPITSFLVRTTNVARPPQLGIDDVTFGTAETSSVPEPSSAILLALAAVCGAVLYPRKRKALELHSSPNS